MIFTRILGQEDIEDGEVWRDCNQCWICQKWKKHQITFKQEDMHNMKQNIQRLYELDSVLQMSLDPKNDSQIQRVHPGTIKIVQDNSKDKQSGQNLNEADPGAAVPTAGGEDKRKSQSTHS